MAENNTVPEIKLTLDPFGEKLEEEAQAAAADTVDIKEQAVRLTDSQNQI